MPSSPTPTDRLAPAPGTQPQTDLEVRRSHFLGRAARARTEAEARAFIASVRADHPTARHHCSAFVVDGGPGALPVERSSDDGEPSGTAGTPILEVLRGSGLVEVAVVVTRYFGGTLLGTGGLVHAYTEAATQALAAASLVRLSERHVWEASVPVADAGRLEADLRGLAGTPAAPGLGVEETLWGPTHALLTLTTDDADPAAVDALLAGLTQGRVRAEAAGARVTETPVGTAG